MILQQTSISPDLITILQRSLSIQELIVSVIANATYNPTCSCSEFQQSIWPSTPPAPPSTFQCHDSAAAAVPRCHPSLQNSWGVHDADFTAQDTQYTTQTCPPTYMSTSYAQPNYNDPVSCNASTADLPFALSPHYPSYAHSSANPGHVFVNNLECPGQEVPPELTANFPCLPGHNHDTCQTLANERFQPCNKQTQTELNIDTKLGSNVRQKHPQADPIQRAQRQQRGSTDESEETNWILVRRRKRHPGMRSHPIARDHCRRREYAKQQTVSHGQQANIVAKALSASYHQRTNLRYNPRIRRLWNYITKGRNTHPNFAHSTQLKSMMNVLQEEQARQSIENDESLDFAIIHAKHLSLSQIEIKRAHEQGENRTLWKLAKTSHEREETVARSVITKAERQARKLLRDTAPTSETEATLPPTTPRREPPVSVYHNWLPNDRLRREPLAHICERILRKFPEEVLTPSLHMQVESDEKCSELPDLQSSSSEDSDKNPEQGRKTTTDTKCTPAFVPHYFPVPNKMGDLMTDHGHQCLWDLIALNNLFCSLPRASLSDTDLVDIFFDPSLTPVKMIAYLQNCSVPKDTISLLVRLRHETGYTKVQSLRQEIQKNKLFAEYAQVHNMIVLHQPKDSFTYTCAKGDHCPT